MSRMNCDGTSIRDESPQFLRDRNFGVFLEVASLWINWICPKDQISYFYPTKTSPKTSCFDTILTQFEGNFLTGYPINISRYRLSHRRDPPACVSRGDPTCTTSLRTLHLRRSRALTPLTHKIELPEGPSQVPLAPVVNKWDLILIWLS